MADSHHSSDFKGCLGPFGWARHTKEAFRVRHSSDFGVGPVPLGWASETQEVV